MDSLENSGCWPYLFQDETTAVIEPLLTIEQCFKCPKIKSLGGICSGHQRRFIFASQNTVLCINKNDARWIRIHFPGHTRSIWVTGGIWAGLGFSAFTGHANRFWEWPHWLDFSWFRRYIWIHMLILFYLFIHSLNYLFLSLKCSSVVHNTGSVLCTTHDASNLERHLFHFTRTSFIKTINHVFTLSFYDNSDKHR